MRGRKTKFPLPSDYGSAKPVLLCTGERVLDLYNQGSGDTAQRIAKKVKKWFVAKAKNKGWAACEFVPQVQTQHSAGCLLLHTPPIRVSVTSITIELPKDEGEE